MGVSSLPKTVTRQRRDCDLNSGPSAPESSTLTTRLPSHPFAEKEGFKAAGRAEAAAVDHYFSSPTENIPLPVSLRTLETDR